MEAVARERSRRSRESEGKKTGESTEADHEQPSPLARAMIEKLRPYSHRAGHSHPYFSSSIYRVPPNIRRVNPAAYEPQILSVGPYHHGNPRLRSMEEHKWRYLHKLLARRPQGDDCSKTLEVCIEKVRRSEARARRFYSEPLYLSSDEFVKMMVLDACFVLEICLGCYDGEEDDPIFAVAWMMPLIWSDLFKLENQIPFFILEDLFSLAAGPSVSDLSLRELVFSYLMLRRSQMRRFILGISAETSLTLSGDREIYHLLHFYALVLRPTPENTGSSISRRPSSSVKSILEKMKPFKSSSCTLPMSDRDEPTEGRCRRTTIPGIVELRESGIECRRKTETTSFMDVTFRDGTLDIPRVYFDNSSTLVARNMVAFEQCCPNAGDHFAAYNLFLACIANTAEDVAMLQQVGIVENRLASDELAARLVMQLSEEVTIRNKEHYLAKLFREVNEHCNSKWYQHRARLKRYCFKHPWASVSVVAATALLLMTLLQVVYVVLSYYYK